MPGTHQDRERRNHGRIVLELLMRDEPAGEGMADIHLSDAIRVMRPFLNASESRKDEPDKFEAMFRRREPPTVLSAEIQRTIEDIQQQLQFSMHYMSYLAAQSMGLHERPCDISLTGISFPSQYAVEPGDGMKVTLLLPQEPPFISSLIVQVAWVQRKESKQNMPYRIGGAFLYRNPCEKAVVSRFISHFHRSST